MRIPALDENYVTFKPINQDSTKNQSVPDVISINKGISITDLLIFINDSGGTLVETGGGHVIPFTWLNPHVFSNNNELFMVICYYGAIRFISATNYEHAIDMFNRYTPNDTIEFIAEVVPVNIVKEG